MLHTSVYQEEHVTFNESCDGAGEFGRAGSNTVDKRIENRD